MSTSGGGCGSLDKATKAYMFEYQPPATLNQAAPVQNTWYEIGGAGYWATRNNIRIYQVGVAVEDDDETLEVRFTIDGETATGSLATAHSTNQFARLSGDAINRVDELILSTSNFIAGRGYTHLDGLSIKIEVRKTTAAGTGNLTGIVIYGMLTSI